MTPAEKRAISIAYKRTGNAAEVARELGMEAGTVRAYLRSRGRMNKRQPGTSRTTVWRRGRGE